MSPSELIAERAAVDLENRTEAYALECAYRAYDWAVFNGRLGSADVEAEAAYQAGRADFLETHGLDAMLRKAGDL